MRTVILCLCLFAVNFFWITACAKAHEGHEHQRSAAENATASSRKTEAKVDEKPNSFVSGGKHYVWKHRPDLGKQSDALIEAAKGRLHNSADQDLNTGEIVTVVAKHGLITLDADLKEWKLVEPQDAAFAKGMNSHGADCFLVDGESFWAFASTNTGEVIVCQRGKIIARLAKPKGDEFDNPTANRYYKLGGKFNPCDVVYLPEAKRLVVVTGYSPGDFALSAELHEGTWKWTGAAWGGKEAAGGLFRTAHGVEVASEEGQEIVEVASRSHGRLFAFTANGAQIKTPGSDKEYYLSLPEGSKPCDISHYGANRFVPLLWNLPGTKAPAPVLVLDGGKRVGALTPATFDGLSHMLHMHGFCAFEKEGKLFGIALSWRSKGQHDKGQLNDGRIEIFEAVGQ